MSASSPRPLLESCLAAAIRAADPRPAMDRVLATRTPPDVPVFIIAAGKASEAMAESLVAWLALHRRNPAGGIVVGTETATAIHPSVLALVGDHPVPGAASHAAARAIHELVGTIPSRSAVHVAISGGASSLIAGPLPGLAMNDVTALFRLLLHSGLEIGAVNAVRKRVSRWSAGRLALACHPSAMTAWVVSDVPGDDLATIGSGPCTADPWTAEAVRSVLNRSGVGARMPAGLNPAFVRDTPSPSLVPEVESVVVASNTTAMQGAVAAAQAADCLIRVDHDLLSGDAAEAGRRLAATAINAAREWHAQNEVLKDEGFGGALRPLFLAWGGETTVRITGEPGRGGRCQELALAAAEALEVSPHPVTLLAAGTDGRDGPTDAAGAVIDQTTWEQIGELGIDGAAALAGHDTHRALDAVGALVRTGPTGTNVMDVVFAVVMPAPATGSGD
ncbi:MAG: DUF4147 domain-containing protein [Gemmatimonadales bacterium]|nr:DUF4147 domain-containing protein [Gemmatimonadales bacterium]